MPCEIVVFRYRFGVHFCRFSLLSFLPPFLAAFRSAWYARCGQGFLRFPAGSRCATSPGSISHTGRSFDWNNPSMNYLYHRTFLSLVPYVHKKGIKGKYRKFPRLWKVWYNPVRRQGSSRWKGACAHERSDYHTGTPLGTAQG